MIAAAELAGRLEEVAEGTVAAGLPLAPFTSYRIGGPTKLWVEPGSVEAVGRVLEIVAGAGEPLLLLGFGSNLLVSDEGWPGVTVHIGGALSGWSFRGEEATVEAGTELLALIHEAAGRGLGGMERMAGIPGSVGGALRMNAGAFGQEIEGCTIEVSGFTREGSPFRLEQGEIGFGYRGATALQGKVITSARFRFHEGDAATLAERVEETLARRRASQPLEYPSCGSVFRKAWIARGEPGWELIEEVLAKGEPIGGKVFEDRAVVSVGWLNEVAGLKGLQVGAARISEKHGGFIVNLGGAEAGDVFRLIQIVERTMEERYGIILQREVKLVGRFEDDEQEE